jgi:hypothetical protein
LAIFDPLDDFAEENQPGASLGVAFARRRPVNFIVIADVHLFVTPEKKRHLLDTMQSLGRRQMRMDQRRRSAQQQPVEKAISRGDCRQWRLFLRLASLHRIKSGTRLDGRASAELSLFQLPGERSGRAKCVDE